MNACWTKAWIAAAVFAAAAAALQLPPDMQADRYLLQADEQIERRNFAAAKQSLDRILALQDQHGLELPQEFYFRYAEVVERLGLYDEAIESVTKYLTLAGRSGEHYRAALRLLNSAEAEKNNPIAGMEFVQIPAGEFLMGSESEEAVDREQPVTRVRISQGFYLGKYEVTQGQWQAVMGSNPSFVKQCGPDCPVETVSWDDVQEFIRKLNAAMGEERYRLPTEAEWEYAARAGTSGDRYGNVDAIAWYVGDRGRGNSGRLTQPVGQKAPNAWGLHDMLGNVNEWVEDWYGDYPGGTVTDPRGPVSGSRRVARGGSWSDIAWYCRASYRTYNSPGDRISILGFRLLRTE